MDMYNHKSLQNKEFTDFLKFSTHASSLDKFHKKLIEYPDKFFILDTSSRSRNKYQSMSNVSNLNLDNHMPFFGDDANHVAVNQIYFGYMMTVNIYQLLSDASGKYGVKCLYVLKMIKN